MSIYIKHILFIVTWLIHVENCMSSHAPQYFPARIELKYTKASHLGIGRNVYFWHTDIYTQKDKKYKSNMIDAQTIAIDFMLPHPIYDFLLSGQRKIPFYIEPNDTLIINIGNTGQILSYENKKGKKAKFANMLKHDISNNTLYDNTMFNSDCENGSFTRFVENITYRMQQTIDSISNIGRQYDFTDQELSLAICNAKLQYGLWIFEYAPFNSNKIQQYASKHVNGWKTTEAEEYNEKAILDISNYSFMRSIPLHDSICLASRYFPMFLQSYEHTHIINNGKYMYYGETKADSLRMDSVMIAHDKQICNCDTPSLYISLATSRQYIHEKDIQDDAIMLNEVKVIADKPFDEKKWILEQYDKVHNSVPKASFFSPTYWFIDRKRIKDKKRMLDLDKRLSKDTKEREIINKAYKEGMKIIEEKTGKSN